MEVDKFNNKTRLLCRSRRELFKGTALDQLYNRYLDHRSMFHFMEARCCVDVCPACYHSLDHLDCDYRVRSVRPKRNKINFGEIRQKITCRFCRVTTSFRTEISQANSDPRKSNVNTPPASPFEIFSPSPRLSASPSGGKKKKKSNRSKKKQLMKEVSFQQTSGMKKKDRKSGRDSLNDFLGSI